MKFYSETLAKAGKDHLFASEEDLTAAEKQFEEEKEAARRQKEKEEAERAEKARLRKERAEEVNAAYEEAKKAKQKADELFNAFIKDFGSYHATFSTPVTMGGHLFNWLDLFDRIFS